MTTHAHYLTKILTTSVYDIAKETPLDFAKNLSHRLNNHIFLKREDLQDVFSFKIRGAYNKMASLSEAQLKQGVITASAGNHAQGVALSAKHLGCRALIVMPATTPQIKVDASRALGAEVLLYGHSYNDAYDHAMALVKEENMTYIPPFDDPEVIAGQGTIALEITRQHPKKIEVIFVQIGGGGLAAGVAAFIKNVRPDIKVIGVQTEDSCDMHLSIEKGEVVSLSDVGLFSDGTAVKRVGDETFKLCRDLLDDIILVNTDDVCAAIKDIFDDTRSITEPSGALSLAGLKKYIAQNNTVNQTLVAIASGANINFHRLRHVSERTEISEQKEAILAITIPERPGSFLKFIEVLGSRNITEFNYRYGNVDEAHIFVGIQITDGDDLKQILSNLHAAQLPTLDLTHNEMAKIHIRYMVGGRTHRVDNERVFSVEFPEQPGALPRFLSAMRTRWTITLFHYRNHGADYGRVLVGIDVPPEDNALFSAFLSKVGYVCQEQTDNAAYQLFLGS